MFNCMTSVKSHATIGAAPSSFAARKVCVVINTDPNCFTLKWILVNQAWLAGQVTEQIALSYNRICCQAQQIICKALLHYMQYLVCPAATNCNGQITP